MLVGVCILASVSAQRRPRTARDGQGRSRDPDLVTIDEAARLLRVGHRLVRCWARAATTGEHRLDTGQTIRFLRVGRATYVTRNSLQEALR